MRSLDERIRSGQKLIWNFGRARSSCSYLSSFCQRLNLGWQFDISGDGLHFTLTETPKINLNDFVRERSLRVATYPFCPDAILSKKKWPPITNVVLDCWLIFLDWREASDAHLRLTTVYCLLHVQSEIRLWCFARCQGYRFDGSYYLFVFFFNMRRVDLLIQAYSNCLSL